jgi:hypothetical protein
VIEKKRPINNDGIDVWSGKRFLSQKTRQSDPQKTAKTHDDLLQQGNGSRQTVMSRETIAMLLRLVADKDQMLWARSHETNSGYGNSSSATFAFCARIGADELCIAIKLGPAKKGSPGRAWSDLKPWRPGMRVGESREPYCRRLFGMSGRRNKGTFPAVAASIHFYG